MKKRYNVLIIDDHPLISNAYKNILQDISESNHLLKFNINVANNCEIGYQKIKNASNKKEIDLVLLDIRLPPFKNSKILSGEDLGIKLRQLLPDSKIIISTAINNNYRIQSILRSINPDGFLIKNDITPRELVNAIQIVINEPPYYSKTVIKLLRMQICTDFLLDRIDRQLLYELSIGTKMKDLPKTIPLSIAGIEKRKRRLKEIFEVKNHGDQYLLLKAKDKGFI